MDLTPFEFVLALLVAMAIGAIGAGFWFGLREIVQRLEHLEDVVAKRRHTYPTADGLLDGLAVAIDVLLEEQAQSKYRQARIEQLSKILGEVGEGPLAYRAEQAAVRPPRPDGRGKR